MRRLLTILVSFSLLLSAFSFSGCGPFWVNPYITVTDSPLNWMIIHYYSIKKDHPIRRISVEIRGTGYVEVKKGTSELVSNDFAKKYNAKDWRNVRTFRINIPPEHVKDIFQDLVNHGVLDREKTGKASDRKEFDRYVAVKANLNNTTFSDNENIFKVDPDLAERLVDVVREFESPAR